MHRTIVSFSVGTRLIHCHPNERRLVVALALVFALSSPLFATLGLILKSSAMGDLLKAQLSVLLIGLSIGTILRITFFELLMPEHVSGGGQLAKFLATIGGMIVIAAAAFL